MVWTSAWAGYNACYVYHLASEKDQLGSWMSSEDWATIIATLSANNRSWVSLSLNTSSASLMPANCAVVSTLQSEEPTTHLQEIQDTRYAYPVSTLTDCSSSCVRQSTTASLMSSSYIPDTRLETWRRYEIGFLTVAGCLCMARF